jgi:protein-S-isoprenylcysteine O-methyltransferase Ste14
MEIWLVIVITWVVHAAAGAAHGVSVPWLVTIGCWACVDLTWNRLARRNAPVADGRAVPIRLRIVTVIPHLLYCLPLRDVPILGLRLLPSSPPMQWVGAAMCVTGVGFAIYARRLLAKNWSADVAITQAHALVQRGPYAVVRHPIYLGFLVAQLGMILALGLNQAYSLSLVS